MWWKMLIHRADYAETRHIRTKQATIFGYLVNHYAAPRARHMGSHLGTPSTEKGIKMTHRVKLWLVVAIVVVLASGMSAAIVFAGRPGWRINGAPLFVDGAMTGKAEKKITIKLPGAFEVTCEKLKTPIETKITNAGTPAEPVIYIGSFSAEECNKVTNLEASEEEKCEVEGKAIKFNELEAPVVWKEASGSERYLYFDQTFNNGAWETSDPLWAKIKIKSIAGKTCPSLLMGMHPLNGQMLAKLKLPTSEQVKKIFTSIETGGSCSKATTYYQGEPRTSHVSEGLMIGGEKGAELCGEFELELENGEEFAVT